MNRLLPLLLLPLAAACQRAVPTATATVGSAPLAGARIGGPFALTDQHGRAVTDRDYAGRWRIMYFGYSFCPDVCPTDLAALMTGYHRFAARDAARAHRLVPIFVSVDPGRDTPAALARYAAAFGPELVALTGTPEQVAAVAKAYGVSYSIERPPGASDYLVSHSRQAYLMDPEGRPVALLPQDRGPDAVAAELDRWVR